MFTALQMLSNTQEEVAASERRRFVSYRLADELRQSSDDLTRMARMFVQTGEEHYAEHFQEILDVRNGKSARPVDSYLVYWDLVLKDDKRPRPNGEAKSLEKLMIEQGFSVEEFVELRTAQETSDGLVRLETIALNSVRGRFDDGTGKYRRVGPPDTALARSMLFGDDYMEIKAEIMKPINRFLLLINERTKNEVDELRAHGNHLLFISLGVSIASLLFCIASLILLRNRVLRPLGQLATAASDVSAGDYSIELDHTSTDEMGRLVAAFNLMVNNINVTLSELKQKNKELEEQGIELDKERVKAEELLLNIMPSAIAERLKHGETSIADAFPEVSVLFIDLVGFTQMTSSIGPYELVKLLNEIFGIFDKRLDEFGLEKIKTIGDSYMAVSGLPEPVVDHAFRIGNFALAIQHDFNEYVREQGMTLNMRIGVHSGTAVAGIIGTKKYAYDLWGDVVNVASRMESTGTPGKIHVSEAFMVRLEDVYQFEACGEMEVKGKGLMTTYFLTGKKF